MKASDLTSADIGKRVKTTIEGMVGAIDTSGFPVCIHTDSGILVWFPATAEVEIIPSTPKVGDRVMVSGYEHQASLLAVDGEDAWIKWVSGNRTTRRLSTPTTIPCDEVKS